MEYQVRQLKGVIGEENVEPVIGCLKGMKKSFITLCGSDYNSMCNAIIGSLQTIKASREKALAQKEKLAQKTGK